MSKAALLDSVKEELRLAEKRLGNDRWALQGAGAKRNPPDAKRRKVLKARIAATTALVKELRAARDKLSERVPTQKPTPRSRGRDADEATTRHARSVLDEARERVGV